jgi:hypothetical protein
VGALFEPIQAGGSTSPGLDRLRCQPFLSFHSPGPWPTARCVTSSSSSASSSTWRLASPRRLSKHRRSSAGRFIISLLGAVEGCVPRSHQPTQLSSATIASVEAVPHRHEMSRIADYRRMRIQPFLSRRSGRRVARFGLGDNPCTSRASPLRYTNLGSARTLLGTIGTRKVRHETSFVE